MAKFSPTRRGNACEICSDISGKCRVHRDGEILLCMGYANARLGEIIDGYKCIKTNSGKGWATFKLDNTAEWTQEQKAEWERQRQARREQADRENADRQRRSLSAVERDSEYRQILDSLELHPDDLADLQRRGFTEEEIELSGFKSVRGNQRLKFPANSRLPGVTHNGEYLICEEGYLCPIRNAEGKIIACQIRLRNPKDGNRYRWLSSKNAVLHLFPDGSKEGELPIAYVKPVSKASQIWVVEGTGAKPFMVSRRLGAITIGAAGGQFISSPQLFREYLEAATRETGSTEIIIPPDAGDVNNPSVMYRWKDTIKLLKEWGYSVKIAWWEQFTKEDCDIDELDTFSQIQFISPESFYRFQPQSLPEEESQNKSDSQSSKSESNGEKSAKNFAKDAGIPSKKTYAEKAKEEWLKSRKFTAKHIIENSEGWLKRSVPKENTITFIKSGLGTGKTTQVIEWVMSLIDETWRNLGYRNTLLFQFCAKTDKATEERFGKKDGFYHLHEHSDNRFSVTSISKISACVHSILHFKPESFDECNLLLDETVSVVRALFEDTNIRSHEKVLKMFEEAVKRARRVICLDGLMNDWVVKYISSLAPDKEIVTVKNIDNRTKPIVNFLEGTIDLDPEKVKKNDRSPWLELIFEVAQRPAIATDSQVMAEWLDEALSAEGYKVLRIDSKTVPEDYVKEFMQDCDDYISREKPDVIIYTPSAESGLDVSIKGYFTHHVAFFFGVLSVDSYLQMLGRIRDNIPKYVWCREWVAKEESAESRSPFVPTLEKCLLAATKLDITDCFSGETEDLRQAITSRLSELINLASNIHFQTFTQVKAIRNYERGNLRECLLEAIKEAGYPVRNCKFKSNEEMKDENKDGVERVKRRNSHDIFTAEKIDINNADFGGNFDARWEERVKAIQANIRKQLPGIEDTDSWNEEFIYKIKYENRNFITQNRRYWLFKNSEVALRTQQERWNRIFHQESVSLARVRSERAFVEALRKTGIEQLINSGSEWSEADSLIQEIAEIGKKPEISNALGCHPGKSSPIKYVGKLVRMLGLKFEGRQQRQEGNQVRAYRVTGQNDPDRLNAQACLTRKYAKYLAGEVEELKWAELPTVQGLEGVTHTPENYIYSLGGMCDSNSELKARGEVLNTGEESEAMELDRAVAAFAVADTLDAFVNVTANYNSETVEDAVFLQPLPIRQRLQGWLEAIRVEEGDSAAIIQDSVELGTPFDASVAYGVLKGIKPHYKPIWSQMKARIWSMVPSEVREQFRALVAEARQAGLIPVSEFG